MRCKKISLFLLLHLISNINVEKPELKKKKLFGSAESETRQTNWRPVKSNSKRGILEFSWLETSSM